jgi:hypothetical protein
MHNFGVMARSLLNGDFDFFALCDFNELGVAKIAHSATSARLVLQQDVRISHQPIVVEPENNLHAIENKLVRAARQHRSTHL